MKDFMGSPLDVTPRESIEITNRHSRAEVSNNLEAIVQTLSEWDIQFSLVADGLDGLVVNEAHDLETVRGWYAANRGGYDLLPNAVHTKQVATSWYRFHEVLAEITHHGEVPEGVPHPPFPAPGEDGTDPAGGPYWFAICVLFPVSPDGIVGELAVWQFDMKELFQGRWEPAEPVEGPAPWLNGIEFRNGKMLKSFAAAWKEGDVGAMVSDFADDCYCVLRVVDLDDDTQRERSVQRGKEELRTAFASETYGRVEDLTVITILQAPWYVFIEYDLQVELPGRGRRDRKVAAVYPVSRAGKLLGQLAYATDRAAQD